MFNRLRLIVVFVFLSILVFVGTGCDATLTPSPDPTASPTVSPTLSPEPSPTTEPVVPKNEQFGIAWGTNFRIAAPRPPTQMATDIGMSWDRWTFKWPRIEYPDCLTEFCFAEREYEYDEEAWDYGDAIEDDRNAGLEILGVLNGIPEAKYYVRLGDVPYREENQDWHWGTIQGLEEAIWVDPSKSAPNPNNPWAYFVYATTNEYAGAVSAWQIGNECDNFDQRNFPLAPSEYITAVQVAYEIIQVTDPNAKLVLCSPTVGEAALVLRDKEERWYGAVLNSLAESVVKDKIIIGLHDYSSDYTFTPSLIADTSANPVLSGRSIWITESGMQHPQVDEGIVIPESLSDNTDNCPKAVDKNGKLLNNYRLKAGRFKDH